jgi:glutathione S-transferase
MDIYGVVYSPFMARVVLAARYKGIKHKISMPADGTKTPAFLKMNPLGKVPVLKDRKTVVFESGVILDYLDAKYKKKPIIPTAAKAVAQTRLIVAMFGDYVQTAAFGLWPQADPTKRDQAVVDAALVQLNKVLDATEKVFAGKPFAAGAKFTIADCYAVPALFFLHFLVPQFGIKDPLAGRKKLKKYWAKVNKDKLTRDILGDMNTGLQAVMAANR